MALMFVASPKELAVAAYVECFLNEFSPLTEELIDDLHLSVGEHHVRRFDKSETVEMMIIN